MLFRSKGHRGHISVYSEAGKGTSFLIYLPMLEEKGEVVSEELPEELRGGDERILIVDDEPQVAEMQARLLASLGYQVTHHSQPLQAMERFRDAPQDFDLIITDMTMPKMHGADLAREVMRIRPDMPVILCTGFSELVNEDKARALGIKAFAMKPLARKSIAALIRRVLEEG